jgi:catechol 2,3-dioxygenase-like lactoylglutathione lyase family enzyme
MNYKFIILFISGCFFQVQSAEETISPVTDQVWQEVIISVTDLNRSAQFFREIGDYEIKWQGPVEQSVINTWNVSEKASAEAMLLGPANATTGLIRLVRFDNAGRKVPTRPGSRAWDTGCYFSLMVRMKDMQAIYDDAIAMGWWTETPISYLEFGTSRLNIMIFRGPDGMQIQGYERLAPPLPPEIPEFARITNPFNIMQMVRDRDVAYEFFKDILGFDTFYHGKPYTDAQPAYMPLGIPYNLTTTIPYLASIVYPVKGEFGRMEMIEIDGLDGRDYAEQCHAPNLGILAVRYPVEDIQQLVTTVEERGGVIIGNIKNISLAPYGNMDIISMKTPDGANIQFYELLDE